MAEERYKPFCLREGFHRFGKIGVGAVIMADEAAEQYGERPTHVFVQAGVGAMAGSCVGYFASLYPDNPPKMIVVEPNKADCMFRGAKRGDGEKVVVTGDMDSIMSPYVDDVPVFNLLSALEGRIINDDEDVFMELRMIFYLSRCSGFDLAHTPALTPGQVFRMGTVNAAKSVGMQGKLGELRLKIRNQVIIIIRILQRTELLPDFAIIVTHT